MSLQPLLGIDLVRAQHRADLVVEDLRSGAREGSQPGVHETPEVVGERLAESAGPLRDLESRETVDVYVGGGLLDCAGDVHVIVAVEIGMDPTLKAHLGGSHLPSLPDALRDVVQRQEVGRAA